MTAFRPSTATVEPPAGTKAAATRYRTLSSVAVAGGGSASLIVCRLETGRTHQIRVHMQALGHPLVGDATYGRSREPITFGRQALHAWRLRLAHPRTHDTMGWQADLPADLATLISHLGLDDGRLSAVPIDADDDD